MPKYVRMPKDDEDGKPEKPGRKEFREDIAAAIKDSKGKKKAPKKRRGKKGKYDDISSKELYQMVKGKRD